MSSWGIGKVPPFLPPIFLKSHKLLAESLRRQTLLESKLGELLSSCLRNKRKDCVLVGVEPCAALLMAGFSLILHSGRYHYFVVLVQAQLGDKGHLGNGEGEMKQSSCRGNENFHVLR